MQKYATRGHEDIGAASTAGTCPTPPGDRKRRCEKAALVAKRNAGLAGTYDFLAPTVLSSTE
jgi:hypothetical protein